MNNIEYFANCLWFLVAKSYLYSIYQIPFLFSRLNYPMSGSDSQQFSSFSRCIFIYYFEFINKWRENDIYQNQDEYIERI